MWQMKTKTKQQKLSITYGNPKYYIMTPFFIAIPQNADAWQGNG